MPFSLTTTSLIKLKRVGPKYSRLLKKVGLETVQDLLFYFPHRYEDLSIIQPIIAAQPKQKITIQGQILTVENSRSPKKRMVITQATISDQHSIIRAVWFNQPFLVKTLQPGKLVNLAGKARIDKQGIYLSSPVYEIIRPGPQKPTVHTGRLVPVYHETNNLSSRYLRYLIKPLLPLTKQVKDWLPQKIKLEHKLLTLDYALCQIHFPDNRDLAEKAKERMAFNEMFLVQLLVLSLKRQIKQQRAFPISFNLKLTKKFVNSLPFKLTNAQRRCAWEILQDLQKTEPMNRLLEGDVGSGKTVVATIAILKTIKAGYQAVLMAPTEILAQQHFRELKQLLKKFKVRIGLLTSNAVQISQKPKPKIGPQDKRPSQKSKFSRPKLLAQVKNGEINLLIGTHALLQKVVKFKNLALVVIDEQHRFGVKQRAKLINVNTDKTMPHLLSMSATPIPRSLALSIYGDLDLSLLDEMPQNRQKIISQIVSPAARLQTYQFIKEQIKKGRQAFVICPRIEEQLTNMTAPFQDISSKIKQQTKNIQQRLLWSEVKAVKKEYEKLTKSIFPYFKIAMLHGQLKPPKKYQIMQDFKKGKIDILIATSVVEVGVDIPNATVMMIEGAECFGLAQLHQFRGRVGRGACQSYCFVFTDSFSRKAQQRLWALLETEDGFRLAEKDLQIRGPGQFLGNQQSGIPDLAMNALTNPKIIYCARQSAQKLLSQDPQIKKYPLLRERLKKSQKTIHLE